jgi:hypothetical protein
MKAIRSFVAGIIALWFAAAASAVQVISLEGPWRFQLDPGDQGPTEKWFARQLAGNIKLPGSLPAQGVGDEIAVHTPWTGEIVDRSWFNDAKSAKYRDANDLKVPFWLQPTKYFKGAAWYQREIEIPTDWRGRRVVLFLERPHWQTSLWVDDEAVGENNALNTPHEYDLGLVAAGKHTLTIRVDNRMIVDIGENSHDISDHTQGNWNGIVGQIELRATPPVWIDDLQVYSHPLSKSVTVRGKIGNLSGAAGNGVVKIACNAKSKIIDVQWDQSRGVFDTELDLGDDAKTWDEFAPNLYRLNATLNGNHEVSVGFGLREISTAGTQFTINGRKTFVRGSLECCIFPMTGHPPTEVDEWKHVIEVAKSYGLNLIRFHSYCPPEAAFIAADELGFYVQVETCWANQSTTLGDGKPVDQWVYDETKRILKYYGNHPSLILMAYGNEPGGKRVDDYLAKYVSHFKAVDSRRLWTSGSGWPQLKENQFHVTPDPRIQHWGEELRSRINAKPPETETDYGRYIRGRSVPVISHEIGQWCAYPNFDEIPEYTGYLKPKNFEIFRDSLAANHMGDLAREFLMASGKLQAICYKEEIEAELRTPGMGGFELLGLHDFPGQGTALVGVLNPLWREKGYIDAAQYRRFCNSTVPLARLSKRVFTTDEKLAARIEVAHFGSRPLANARTSWKLECDDGSVAASGNLPAIMIPVDNGVKLGEVSIDLSGIAAPAHCKLVVAIEPKGGNALENDWDVWVYHASRSDDVPADITVTHEMNDQAAAALDAGGKLLLLIPPSDVRNLSPNPVKLGFSSIFWNTAWTRRQAPTTLGILCDPRQPLFAEFPTEEHSNWQWWYLVTSAKAMILDDFPVELRPTVQVIDDWVTNHRLGLLFEAKLGGVKLIVCSIDLDRAQDPVTRQFRHSLLQYMESKAFDPKTKVDLDQVRSLFAKN